MPPPSIGRPRTHSANRLSANARPRSWNTHLRKHPRRDCRHGRQHPRSTQPMNNPIELFASLPQMYIRYLESPFDLRYPDLRAERRALLDQDGHIYRQPLIEPVPSYQTCQDPLPQVAQQTLANHWSPQEIADLSAFGTLELFPLQPRPRRPYTHQRDVLVESVANGNDVVITTGTGSGKTECFLLPIIAALVKESRSWGNVPPRDPQWDWWRHGPQRRSQRAHEDGTERHVAMRALVLYPLNALVEDQLSRLRTALDGDAARQWLAGNRPGNRFYFGRYTGRTPVAGQPGVAAKISRLRRELRTASAEAQRVLGTEAARFFPRLDGGEMWSRWDMQESPPDILITNYSMLNIMLMRSLETNIFDATRRWLARSRTNMFHLVVDELHTYRGTPGTEVAYLIRVLIERLGLAPDSSQLRIIASSASITKDTSGLAYLEQFFARDRNRFRLIGGNTSAIQAGAVAAVQNQAAALRDLGSTLAAGGDIQNAATAFHAAVGAPAAPDQSAGSILCSAMEHIAAPSALRHACAPDGSPVSRPIMPAPLGELLFPALQPEQRAKAVEGLLAGLSLSRDADSKAPLPIRAHMFFRNLQGLWVCPNPSCNAAPQRTGPCPVGSLHYAPTVTCPCGSRVLELIYCEACGEVLLGGYRRQGNGFEWYLSPDHPDLESSPDLVAMNRDYARYAVFWPAPGNAVPASTSWTEDNVSRRWTRGHCVPVEGKVSHGGNNNAVRGYIYDVRDLHGPNGEILDWRAQNLPEKSKHALPKSCPRCDTP